METGDGGGEKSGDSGGEKRDIRRPMNAFLIFCKRHRSMVREKHPDRDNRSVTRILGDLWANLPDEEKAVYTNLAKTYKDAFMKANPDYKWHSTDRLPQPAKMATRPTNVRPPRSLSASDAPPLGHSDGDKMGGVNLLLLAGKHSLPAGDQLSSSLASDNKLTSSDLMGANSALLQLAEMCSSSELAVPTMDPAALRSAPPKKRARHWSHSDTFQNDIADKTKLTPTPLFFNASKPLPLPTATQTSQSETLAQKQDHFHQPIRQSGIIIPRKEMEPYNTFKPIHIAAQPPSMKSDESPPPKGLKEPVSLDMQTTILPTPEGSLVQPEVISSAVRSETFSMDVGMPPKKKFTKLHDRYKEERQITAAAAAAAAAAPSSDSGCLSDQNDNAIFTCGKLVVDHIIDRLFSANLTPSEHNEAMGPSTTDIEKVRKIITADITEREKSQGPSSREMGKILSEVVQKPQNLVEKVIEEAYNMDLKRRAKQDVPVSSEASPRATVVEELEQKPALLPRPAVVGKGERPFRMEPILEQALPVQPLPEVKRAEVKHEPALLVPSAPLPLFHTSSNGEAPQPPSKFTPLLASKEEREERYMEEMILEHSKEEVGGEYLPDEEEGYSQPVRKSRRRNRGQRYQELINEGIIQPSKERLAARRHEQIPAVAPVPLSASLMTGEEMGDDELGLLERSRQMLKRSNSEIDAMGPDEKRYRTGDFDLEAEIATLPPCSLDQVPRRRGPRKRSDSENGRRGTTSPSFGQMKEESRSPEPGQGSSSMSSTASSASTSQPVVPTEPLTGSQKRKARKHSINRLVASTSTDSGSKAKPPGIEAAIPMVRDATVSPVRGPRSLSTPAAGESSASATSTTSAALLVGAGRLLPLTAAKESVLDREEHSLQITSVQQDSVDRLLKRKKSVETAERVCVSGERKMLTAQQEPVNILHTTFSDVGDRPNVKKNPSAVKLVARESVSKKSVDCSKKESVLMEKSNAATGFQTAIVCDGDNSKESLASSVSEVCVKAQKVTDRAAEQGKGVSVSLSFSGGANSINQGCVDSSAVIENLAVGLDRVTDRDEDSAQPPLSPVGSSCFVSSLQENKIQPKRQLKEMLSSDSGPFSSLEECEDRCRETTLDSIEEDDKPCVFLSETSGLLCITQPIPQKSVDLELAESSESLKKASVLRHKAADQQLDTVSTRLTSIDSQGDTVVEDSASRSTVAVDTEDSLDDGNCVLTASSESLSQVEVDFSPFSSGSTATTGPRVTTVTMTTTDAIPTALSLEMMEEEGMVDSGMGNPMLCGSPMPESPSMTAVHS